MGLPCHFLIGLVIFVVIVIIIFIEIQDDFTAWDYLVMCVYGLIVVISLFGNGLVFSVIIRTRSVLTFITIFIFRLNKIFLAEDLYNLAKNTLPHHHDHHPAKYDNQCQDQAKLRFIGGGIIKL